MDFRTTYLNYIFENIEIIEISKHFSRQLIYLQIMIKNIKFGSKNKLINFIYFLNNNSPLDQKILHEI